MADSKKKQTKVYLIPESEPRDSTLITIYGKNKETCYRKSKITTKEI